MKVAGDLLVEGLLWGWKGPRGGGEVTATIGESRYIFIPMWSTFLRYFVCRMITTTWYLIIQQPHGLYPTCFGLIQKQMPMYHGSDPPPSGNLLRRRCIRGTSPESGNPPTRWQSWSQSSNPTVTDKKRAAFKDRGGVNLWLVTDRKDRDIRHCSC